MPHDVSLIATIAAGFGLAMMFGLLAVRLRLPPLVGYLLAGVLVSPSTPGFVADVGLAGQLAEIGVMLLMFGVGLHFSLDELMAVRRIAIPGAIVQIAVAPVLGMAAAHLLGQFIAAREIDRMTNPDARVARSLAALFNPVLYPGVGELLRITQQELAYLVGLSRQRVNEALNALQAQGVMRVEYGGLPGLGLDALRSSIFAKPTR